MLPLPYGTESGRLRKRVVKQRNILGNTLDDLQQTTSQSWATVSSATLPIHRFVF
jgi:hypothetical protein